MEELTIELMQVSLLPARLQLQLRLDIVCHNELQDSLQVILRVRSLKCRSQPYLTKVCKDLSLSITGRAHEVPHNTHFCPQRKCNIKSQAVLLYSMYCRTRQIQGDYPHWGLCRSA